MSDIKMNFSTYSEAAAMYDRLKSNNVNARIVRTPASLNRSCGYSLRISDNDAGKVSRTVSNLPRPDIYPKNMFF